MTAETVLAFDFGERRIGVAVGNDFLRQAQPLETIEAPSSEALFSRVAELIRQWQPQRLVVGIPYSGVEADEEPTSAAAPNRAAHPQRDRCERFANRLHGRFKLPVERVDERYSSVDADSARRELRRSGISRRMRTTDQIAAQLILQRWFDAKSEAIDPALSHPSRNHAA